MISFVKAHACGNDFLVVGAEGVPAEERSATAVRLCARTTGVGADGVEYLEWTGERSGRIRLFNADGSFAEISGNGTRCVAAWMAHERQAAAGDVLVVETDAGRRECRIVETGERRFEIAMGMGVPELKAASVLLAGGLRVEGTVVSMGNPHFVIFVEQETFAVDGRSWEQMGREICFHPDFPGQTNVELVRVVSQREIEIRIFERGAGPTASSGTGTCASAAAAIRFRGLDADLRVRAPGGEQAVNWPGGPAAMMLTGPAELVATGEAF